MKRQMNGHCKAASMAMNCWRDQALNWSRLILPRQKKAEQQIESCEHCHPANAEIPFDWLLAEVTGRRGVVEFVLAEAVRCPNCKHEITEKTLVEPKDA